MSSATEANGFVADTTNGYYFSTGSWDRALFIAKDLFMSGEITALCRVRLQP
ncbi:hypothetical protein [Prevotella sp. AGR2160]|uniref:hypothetical protein n=1 Tax=Prevotella sp. AGR2160 TaxID=1280674 RepID=UPI0004245329|nr:hypothetical protein [Prevotella sp. AGR2160]